MRKVISNLKKGEKIQILTSIIMILLTLYQVDFFIFIKNMFENINTDWFYFALIFACIVWIFIILFRKRKQINRDIQNEKEQIITNALHDHAIWIRFLHTVILNMVNKNEFKITYNDIGSKLPSGERDLIKKHLGFKDIISKDKPYSEFSSNELFEMRNYSDPHFFSLLEKRFVT